MTKRLLCAANWKMHLGPTSAAAFLDGFLPTFASRDDREVWLFPPAVTLPGVAARVAGTGIVCGAQNVHWEETGAFTGEVSVPLAVEAITEVKTQCGQMLEMIASQVEGARGHEEAIATHLQDASSQHGEVLSAIRTQLENNTQAIRRAVESYESVTESVNEVLKACCKLQESFGSLAAAREDKSGAVAQALARNEKAFKLLAIGAGAAAGVALIVAVIGLF